METESFTSFWKPTRPLASNALQDGVYRRAREEALTMRYLETAPAHAKNLMVFDIDQEEAATRIKSLAYDDGSIPEPNFITTNPASEHAHIGYFLEGTIGGGKAGDFYKDVYSALRVATGGDPCFNGRIMRNPLIQPSESLREDPYTLIELKNAIPSGSFDKALQKSKRAQQEGDFLGRADELFHSLRTFAYSFYRASGYDSAALEAALWERALELNFSNFEGDALPQSELRSAVRSVTTFVTKNFTKEKFSEIQRGRIMKRYEVGPARERMRAVEDMVEAGFSNREIAENLGVSIDAAKKAARRARERLSFDVPNSRRWIKLDKLQK